MSWLLKWPKIMWGASAYDLGHKDGFKEGYKEGQQWGHEHGACEHTHPFEGAKAALEMEPQANKRGSGWGTYHNGGQV